MSSTFITDITTIPVAPLKIAALESCTELAKMVDRHIFLQRCNHSSESSSESFSKRSSQNHSSIEFKGYKCDSYLLHCHCPRFGTGEAKGLVEESVRGADLFIMADVGNYSLTYTAFGHENHMSPDNHFQDIKRIIAASSTAKRINVIMPFMYEGRQHRRTKRESLDCALALQELADMGVQNIITFDAHDPRVVNSIPINGFDNYMPPYQFIRTILKVDKYIVYITQ